MWSSFSRVSDRIYISARFFELQRMKKTGITAAMAPAPTYFANLLDFVQNDVLFVVTNLKKCFERKLFFSYSFFTHPGSTLFVCSVFFDSTFHRPTADQFSLVKTFRWKLCGFFFFKAHLRPLVCPLLAFLSSSLLLPNSSEVVTLYLMKSLKVCPSLKMVFWLTMYLRYGHVR